MDPAISVPLEKARKAFDEAARQLSIAAAAASFSNKEWQDRLYGQVMVAQGLRRSL